MAAPEVQKSYGGITVVAPFKKNLPSKGAANTTA
ncbi:MAG: hypothetical protein HZLCBSQH_001696 [Candidatus Fervidibacterota bacterium]